MIISIERFFSAEFHWIFEELLEITHTREIPSYFYDSGIMRSTLHEFFSRQVKYVRITFSILCVHQDLHHILIGRVPFFAKPCLDPFKFLSELIDKFFVIWTEETNFLFKISLLSFQYNVSACFEH